MGGEVYELRLENDREVVVAQIVFDGFHISLADAAR
jgi:hypothetical protein